MINENFARQGWQCPICKTVYSPDTPVCFYCNVGSTKTTTSSNGHSYTACCTGTCYGRDTFGAEDIRGDEE